MNTQKRITEEVIEKLTDREKIQVIAEYEKFERDGHIGDCLLRSLAKTIVGCNYNEVLWMNQIANECYRYFANNWIWQRKI